MSRQYSDIELNMCEDCIRSIYKGFDSIIEVLLISVKKIRNNRAFSFDHEVVDYILKELKLR